MPSLRAKRNNLAVKEINELGIASSQKTLLAMTFQGFFNRLVSPDPESSSGEGQAASEVAFPAVSIEFVSFYSL
ncbi:MAG: hypothetical protein Q8N09_04855 [Thermodesulfovibrionia bacterium]|nr:hypothetical protein [Thermodesulfovibrionia bacterium]